MLVGARAQVVYHLYLEDADHHMERVVHKFRSLAESDDADRDYYLSLSPEQRLDILLELIASYQDGQDEATKGFKRVCRVIKLQAG